MKHRNYQNIIILCSNVDYIKNLSKCKTSLMHVSVTCYLNLNLH